jgi:RNA polymerase sigma-70 factor (ECF subfamily)
MIQGPAMHEVTPDSVETQQLLQAVRMGDRAAYDRLFDLHRASLRQMVERRLDLRLCARIDPSDVVQEAQMEAFRRLPDYMERQPMPFRLWLRKTALERLSNLQRNHLAAARRSVRREVPIPDRSSFELAQRLVASGASPSAHLAARDLARQIQQALAQLPPADREVLLLRYVEQFSNQEVAYLLGIDLSAASKRHGRALLRLQKLLCLGAEP